MSRFLIIFVLVCGTVFAQAVSQISGTTGDTSGAVVPGVEITATQLVTGAKRSSGSSPVTTENCGFCQILAQSRFLVYITEIHGTTDPEANPR